MNIQGDACYHILQTLNEYTRDELVSKGKKETNARYLRRLTIGDSEVYYHNIVTQEFLDRGALVFKIDVRDYELTIEVPGLLDFIRKRRIFKIVTKGTIKRFLEKAFKQNDIKVNCTCPDFHYRFAYAATQKGYKYGSPENRPSNITNPDLKGSCCKHLLKILSDKSWVKQYYTLIKLLIKMNPQLLKKTKKKK